MLLAESDRTDAPPECTSLVQDEQGHCWQLRNGAPAFEPADGGGELLLHALLRALDPRQQPAPAMHWQHPRLGDQVAEPRWLGTADDATPRLHVQWCRSSDQAELVLQRLDDTAHVDADSTPGPLTAIDFDALRAALPATAPAPPAATFRTLAPGVHEITQADVDTRSLAVEFSDHVILCEASLDNPAGERLLSCLDQHLPGKPVRYVLFGHYHPHYTGGLRPVMARGATVVAPPLGAAFAAEIAARPFHEPPDALTRSGSVPIVEVMTGQRTFRDTDNELVAIDIGADSHHTVEYVVFWLPRQRMLFEGDIGWYSVGAGIRPSGLRAAGLVKAIDTLGLPVETLVQSWPTRGRSTLPLAELRTLLSAR
ncbi:MAG: hypothetical protein R3F29_08515 [Planctomycetota bacterium]